MEPNKIGTHEFVEFCRLVGAEPYIAANITSTTPLDIRDWIDYCNSPKGSTAYAKLREAMLSGKSAPAPAIIAEDEPEQLDLTAAPAEAPKDEEPKDEAPKSDKLRQIGSLLRGSSN